VKLTLSQLEALFWIGRLGSVRAAAARLNITLVLF
jgi:DNA-binding transcriptional LysR family regulator